MPEYGLPLKLDRNTSRTDPLSVAEPKGSDSASDSACSNCQKKGRQCVYSQLKRKFRAGTTDSTHTQSTTDVSPPVETQFSVQTNQPANNVVTNHPPEQPRDDQLPQLYVDRLLDTRQPTGRTQMATNVLRANENYLASSGISFFPESRVKALSNQIGTDSMECLIDRISHLIRSRVDLVHPSQDINRICGDFKNPIEVEAAEARSFIDSYFKHVHPLHPFLDRKGFEERAGKPDLQNDLVNSISWSGLYHTILALGCQCQGKGSFQPVQGEAWRYFRVALSLLPKILLLNTGLLEVQAVTSMAIFSLNLSCMQIQGKLISEAARMVQRAGLNKIATGTGNTAGCRVFWVVYYIEKTVTFTNGTTSLLFDYDIGTPVPMIPESIFDGFDWFLTCLRTARLYSSIFMELFSIQATTNPKKFYMSKIDQLEKTLEHHRLTIPVEFRPNDKLPNEYLMSPHTTMAAIRTHMHYHELRIALCRLKLHVNRGQIDHQSVTTTTRMMDSARAVIQLTRMTRMEASTPLYILIFMPLSALLILFDLVIHNPTHAETQANLNLLEAAAGYFSSLEYATDGNLPCSMMVEFAYIARSFIQGNPLRHQLVSNQYETGANLDPNISVPIENWQPNINTATDLSYPPQDNETGLMEHLNFPLNMNDSIGDMSFSGLEIMDLFGAPIDEF